jgi:hypothetical protein
MDYAEDLYLRSEVFKGHRHYEEKKNKGVQIDSP